MAQIAYAQNIGLPPGQLFQASNGTLTFAPFNFYDSISLNTLNFMVMKNDNNNATITFSLGLYSLTGSSLSIANSLSGTYFFQNSVKQFVSFTNTSASQNISPGTWWFGFLISTSGNSNLSIHAGSSVNPGNAFPGGFTGGRMSASTNALPSSIATSALDITGSDATAVPYILISA